MTEQQFQKMIEKNLAVFGDSLMGRFELVLEQSQHDQTRDLKDYIDSSIMASEKRTDGKLDKFKNDIIEGVGSLIDHGVLPQIDVLDRRVTRLERKLA